MEKFIKTITNIKFIIGFIGLLIASLAWAVDYIHKPFLLKTDLLKIFHYRDIASHEQSIVRLQIRQGLATSKNKEQEFEMLISIEKLQILKLKGENYGSN